MTRVGRLVGAAAASAIAVALGVLAAWPIYESARLWLVAGVALVLGVGLAVAREAWRLSLPLFVAAVVVLFAATVAPVAVAQSLDRLPRSLLSGYVDGMASVALGWKQLLTLTLPVGTYQSVMVPAYVVCFATALGVTLLALRPSRWAALASVLLLAPVAFGTVFGSSSVSDPIMLGPLRVAAPHELGLWLAAAALGAAWVVWTAGADRRAALRRGRGAGAARARTGAFVRGLAAAATVAVALVAGIAAVPALDGGQRDVARDRIDPEIVVRDQSSPLAAYRVSKSDAELDLPLFEVSSDGRLPERLRLAVLDAYDGVDFHVGEDAAGRFTRFPSGTAQGETADVTVRIDEGYREIWAPTASLAEPPRFAGPRAEQLADAFYVNRDTEGAIIVPDGQGLEPGDEYTASMAVTGPPGLPEAPEGDAPLIDLEQHPELAQWIEMQSLSTTPEGLAELIQRLRDRGYLSHAISDGEGENLWLERLAEQYGTRFESSAGGHSSARIELLFGQLVAQQRAAGEGATEAQLVAGIGDDEQFATAAALLAQALGYDARVVVGVRTGGEEVPGIPACDRECTGENLAAWIEVRGDGGAWVPFDTTPQPEIRPVILEEGEQLPEFPTVPEERDAREVDPPLGLGEQNDGDQDPVETGDLAWLWPILRAAGLSLAALALLALPILFLPFAKRIRRRRRRAATVTELRALGAWDEMVDQARDAGVPVLARESRTRTADRLGTAPARWAAEQVDRAVFAPAGIVDADAEMLWEAQQADRDERRAGMTRWQRVRQAYSLRSFGVMFGRGFAFARGRGAGRPGARDGETSE